MKLPHNCSKNMQTPFTCLKIPAIVVCNLNPKNGFLTKEFFL